MVSRGFDESALNRIQEDGEGKASENVCPNIVQQGRSHASLSAKSKGCDSPFIKDVITESNVLQHGKEEKKKSTETASQWPASTAFMQGKANTEVGIEPDVNSSCSLTKAFNIHTDGKCGSIPLESRQKRHDIDGKGLMASFHKASFTCSQPPDVCGDDARCNLIAYEACIRLCLHAWAGGCMLASIFLKDEFALLRTAFRLQGITLQPLDKQLRREDDVDLVKEPIAPKQREAIGTVKVEVFRVKILSGMTSSCIFLRPIHGIVKSLANYFLNTKSTLRAKWKSRKASCAILSQHKQTGMDYASPQVSEEEFLCSLQLKNSLKEQFPSLATETSTWMKPGSGVTHTFFPGSQGDTIILEVQDSKGKAYGRVQIKVASVIDNKNVIKWWPLFMEPENKYVGEVKLHLSFLSAPMKASQVKHGPVGLTLAYDLVLEAAMRMQTFQPRNLHLHGPWKWLLAEFSSYYGVSDLYTKLRYLTCIMDIATPTGDCFELIYDLLIPIISARGENLLNHCEKSMLAGIEFQLESLLARTFENYKSLDEVSPSGLVDFSELATTVLAPAIKHAVEVYTLLHDICTPEVQTTLRSYFQTAARKRFMLHVAKAEECMLLMDASTVYSKMRSLCCNIRNEIQTDIEINNQNILPSWIDFPYSTAFVYSVELHKKLKAFLQACPPSGPIKPVSDLVIATCDFQSDLQSWKIKPIKGGMDSKVLFDFYIRMWIQEKQLHLLNICKADKVHIFEANAQNRTSPFIEEIYKCIMQTLDEFEVIVDRLPEFSIQLEKAIATVERDALGSLERHYSDILSPLKDIMVSKKTANYYQRKKIRENALSAYKIPNQVGLVLNTVKKIIDVLHPKVEARLRTWASCLSILVNGEKSAFGEELDQITLLLKIRYKSFSQATIEKLLNNTKVRSITTLTKILKATKEGEDANEIRTRIQPLNTQLIETMQHVHNIFSSDVSVSICHGFWDKIGQEMLSFLQNASKSQYEHSDSSIIGKLWCRKKREDNISLHKGPSYALRILEDTFISEMKRLHGDALSERDLQPPQSTTEAWSILSL